MTLLLSQALEKRGSAGLEYVDHPRGTLRAQNEVIDLHYTLRIISGQKCTYKCTEMLRKNERLFNILRIISSKRSWDQLSRMDNTWNKIILPVTRTFGTSVSSLFQIKQEVCEGRMVVQERLAGRGPSSFLRFYSTHTLQGIQAVRESMFA